MAGFGDKVTIQWNPSVREREAWGIECSECGRTGGVLRPGGTLTLEEGRALMKAQGWFVKERAWDMPLILCPECADIEGVEKVEGGKAT